MSEDSPNRHPPPMRRALPERRWEGVECLAYKPAGSAPFRDIARQVLFDEPALACELRYFEIAPGGHSTLERHAHVHGVMVLHGRGSCLVGTQVAGIGLRDLIRIPPWTWHQFRADRGEPLGFLCLVNRERDRPVLPTADDLALLAAEPRIAEFMRVGAETRDPGDPLPHSYPQTSEIPDENHSTHHDDTSLGIHRPGADPDRPGGVAAGRARADAAAGARRQHDPRQHECLE